MIVFAVWDILTYLLVMKDAGEFLDGLYGDHVR